MRVICAVILGASMLGAGAAGAELITVEPDDFLRGTVISDVIPGLTLSATGRSASGPDILTERPGVGRASTGVLTFGYFTNGFTWRDDSVTQAFFNAEFDEPTSFVAIDIVRSGGEGDTADPGVMWAFDADGNLLETAQTLGGQSDFETLLITRDVADIARVQVTGAVGPIVLDHFRYEAEGGLPPARCEVRLQTCEEDLTRAIDGCTADLEELDACQAEVEWLRVQIDEIVVIANEILRENQRLQEQLDRQHERNRLLRRALRRLRTILAAWWWD